MKNINGNYQYLHNLEKRARYKIIRNYYKYIHVDYNKLIISNLMCNASCHMVAIFKNYLLEDDDSEYLRRIYKKKESIPRLKKLYLYYEETSVIFPNYTPLIESKYLYNNVIKKQRVIDEQQDLEDKRKDKLKVMVKRRKNSPKNQKIEDKVFSNTAYDEILNVSESVLRIVFGLENPNKNKNDKNIDDSNNEEINQLIDNLNIAEETEKSSQIIKSGSKINKSLKLKLNIESSNNMNKLRNYDLLNNVTNSTTISSTNNKQNNNYNCEIPNKTSIHYNTIFSNEKEITVKKIITSPKTTKESISKIYTYHKKNKSTLPNITLYNANFVSSNIFTSSNIIKSIITKPNTNNRNNSIRNNLNTQTNYFKTSNNEIFKTTDIKSNKIIKQVPKLDINKIKNTNTINIFNKTTTNRIIHHHSNTQTNDFFKSGNRTSRQKNMKNDVYKYINKNPINVVITSPLSPNLKKKSIYYKELVTSRGIKTKEKFEKIFDNFTIKQQSSNNKINKKRSIFTRDIITKSNDFHKKIY